MRIAQRCSTGTTTNLGWTVGWLVLKLLCWNISEDIIDTRSSLRQENEDNTKEMLHMTELLFSKRLLQIVWTLDRIAETYRTIQTKTCWRNWNWEHLTGTPSTRCQNGGRTTFWKKYTIKQSFMKLNYVNKN